MINKKPQWMNTLFLNTVMKEEKKNTLKFLAKILFLLYVFYTGHKIRGNLDKFSANFFHFFLLTMLSRYDLFGHEIGIL